MRPITPCLWFDGQAEEAAEFYVSVFPNSRVLDVTRYGEAGRVRERIGDDGGVRAERPPVHRAQRRPRVHVQRGHLVPGALRDQERGRCLWAKLSDGGDPGPCGWVKDRFGVSWQVVPRCCRSSGRPGSRQVAARDAAMLEMKKLDIAELERAAA